MLKRVNIHIDDADLKKLDEIAKQTKCIKFVSWWTTRITRADLIRYALTNTFGFKFDNIHTNFDSLKKALKKALKKITT